MHCCLHWCMCWCLGVGKGVAYHLQEAVLQLCVLAAPQSSGNAWLAVEGVHMMIGCGVEPKPPKQQPAHRQQHPLGLSWLQTVRLPTQHPCVRCLLLLLQTNFLCYELDENSWPTGEQGGAPTGCMCGLYATRNRHTAVLSGACTAVSRLAAAGVLCCRKRHAAVAHPAVPSPVLAVYPEATPPPCHQCLPQHAAVLPACRCCPQHSNRF
jgi:hypothetical protein